MMKKLIFAACLLFLAAPTWAVTHYICDCAGGGQHGSCTPGANGADGLTTSTPWQSISMAHTDIQSTGPGDQVLFCKGGAWAPAATINWANAVSTATAANPLVIDSYTPPWGGSARPILRFTTDAFRLTSYNEHNGITIRNLDLRGPDTVTNTFGFYIYANVQYVLVDNVNIQGFHFGLSSSQNQLTAAELSHDIIVRNSTFLNNRNSGIFTATSNSVYENNVMTNNGGCAGGAGCQGPTLRHSIYAGGSSVPSNNVVIRGNIITRTSYAAGFCEGTVLTAHGYITGLVIENNLIYETTVSGGSCFGIGYGDGYNVANEGLTGGIIRGNTVIGVGNRYFVIGATVGTIIENNVAIVPWAQMAQAFYVDDRNYAVSFVTSGTVIRNNSAYYASGSSGAGISFLATGTGTSNVVTNNLIYIAGGSAACWSSGAKAPGDFTAFNYNLCYNLGTGSNIPPTGLNVNGLTTNPLLVTVPPVSPAWSMAIQSGSPARNSGTGTYCSVRDRLFLARDAACDRGAYEYGASATTLPPSAPVNLR